MNVISVVRAVFRYFCLGSVLTLSSANMLTTVVANVHEWPSLQFRQGNVDDKGSRPYEANLSLSRHAAHQQLLQTTVAVPHSDKTRNFVEIMRQLNDFVMDIDQNACDADFVKMYPLAVENGYMDVRKEEICTAPTEERIDESNIQEDGRKSSCVAVVRQAKLHGISAKVKRPLISPRKAMKKRLETLECSTAGADVEAMLTKKFRSVTDTEKAANRSSHGMFVEPVERKIQTPVFQQDVHPQNAVISTKTTSIHFTADIPRPQLSDVEAPCDTEIERPFEGILAQVSFVLDRINIRKSLSEGSSLSRSS